MNLFLAFTGGVLIGVPCAVHLMPFMSNMSLPHCLFLVFCSYMILLIATAFINREYADMRAVEVSQFTVLVRIQGQSDYFLILEESRIEFSPDPTPLGPNRT